MQILQDERDLRDDCHVPNQNKKNCIEIFATKQALENSPTHSLIQRWVAHGVVRALKNIPARNHQVRSRAKSSGCLITKDHQNAAVTGTFSPQVSMPARTSTGIN